MAKKGSDEDEAERARKIAELKRQAQELVGGKMAEGELEECPPEITEQFWEQVVAYEKAPWTTHCKQLEESGMQLPAPETLDDEQLTRKLGELIQRLALLRVFLEETDHLSDRELYTLLWSDMLREETKAVTLDEDSACHMSPLGGCSEEDIHLYLKYYADEQWRRDWQKEYPEETLPDHEDPPYDRDRFLPRPDYGSASRRGPVN
jgi:hypothetical protein